jgi:hypothetical protein
VRLEGRPAAVGFVDDGAYALVAWSPTGASEHGSRVDLVRVALSGEVERTEVMVGADGLAAAWTGEEFVAVVGESGERDAAWLRVAPDGTATSAPTDARICEELAPTGAGHACLTATTRDASWLVLDDDGRASHTASYAVDGFLRAAVWSAGGPGLLFTSGEDETYGLAFLRLDAGGTVAAGPRLISPAGLADMLLLAAPRGYLGLALTYGSSSDDVPSPTGRRWSAVRLALVFLEPDGTMVYRPVEVGRFVTNGHVPSWGPTHFAAAAAIDDVVVAWRHVDVHADDPGTPERSVLRFQSATPESELGGVIELEPTTDDDFMVEQILVVRAGTGLAVARSHSRAGDLPLALDLWLGCCE